MHASSLSRWVAWLLHQHKRHGDVAGTIPAALRSMGRSTNKLFANVTLEPFKKKAATTTLSTYVCSKCMQSRRPRFRAVHPRLPRSQSPQLSTAQTLVSKSMKREVGNRAQERDCGDTCSIPPSPLPPTKNVEIIE